MTNPDGSVKTECGIHSSSGQLQVATKESEEEAEDLWPGERSNVHELDADEALALNGQRDAVFVVYAPWCRFCQAFEPAFESLTASVPSSVLVAKLRGDTRREFVQQQLGVTSFPTVLATSAQSSGIVKYTSEQRHTSALKHFVEQVISTDDIAALVSHSADEPYEQVA